VPGEKAEGAIEDQSLAAVERAHIVRVLQRTKGNKRQAAKLLNLKRTTLIEKLKRLEPSAGSSKLP